MNMNMDMDKRKNMGETAFGAAFEVIGEGRALLGEGPVWDEKLRLLRS